MTDLTEFLLARVAEEELAARVAQRVSEAAMNITRWHPARVLAECEAKRRIIGSSVGPHIPPPDAATFDYAQGWVRHEFDHIFRLLALPYAEHPDYRLEWLL